MGFLAFFGVVAFFKFQRPDVATILWILAVVVPIIGWAIPAFMRLVFLGMSYLAWPIGFVVSHVVLAAVYYLVITPVGLLLRLFRYDPMKRHFDRDAPSYWIRHDPREGAPDRYFRQF
jgi:hypothetical protein